jgi:hypothetical protein
MAEAGQAAGRRAIHCRSPDWSQLVQVHALQRFGVAPQQRRRTARDIEQHFALLPPRRRAWLPATDHGSLQAAGLLLAAVQLLLQCLPVFPQVRGLIQHQR